MNTREEVLQAIADYQAGRLGSIPAVHNAPTTLVETRVGAGRPSVTGAGFSPSRPRAPAAG